MTEHEPWQLDGTAAELYDRYLVPAITSLWASDLIARAMPQPGERILDVACGTGIVARLAAERMGSGRAVGLDINGGMLAVARSHAPIPGVPIEWHELDDPDLRPDRWTVATVLERVQRAGDPLAPLIGVPQELPEL